MALSIITLESSPSKFSLAIWPGPVQYEVLKGCPSFKAPLTSPEDCDGVIMGSQVGTLDSVTKLTSKP